MMLARGGPRRAGGAAEWWHELVPGARFEVDYSDDEVAHERMALFPVSVTKWAVRSPDGDQWIEDISGDDPESGPCGSRPLRAGPGRAGLPRLYRFRDALSDLQLRWAILGGLRLAHSEEEVANLPKMREVVDAAGARVPFDQFFSGTHSGLMKEYLVALCEPAVAAPGLPVTDGSEHRIFAENDLRAGEVWISLVGCRAGGAGREVVPRVGRDVIFGLKRGMLKVQDEWILAESVPVEQVPAFVANLRGGDREPDLGGEAERDLERRMGVGHEAAPPVVVAPREEQDARTLWVDWDAHGERYKAWREVCLESTQQDIPDSRLEGSPTALHMCKVMERQGGDPRLWMERWVREKRLDNSDRVAHELRSLVEVLYAAGVVDQVNVGGLVCLERVCRRIAVIVEAYAVPSRPSWDHARFYAGTASAEEVIAPALRTLAFKKAKDELELASSRTRTALRGAPAGEGDAGDGGGGDAKGGGKGRGRGKDKPGRGGSPPAEA